MEKHWGDTPSETLNIFKITRVAQASRSFGS